MPGIQPSSYLEVHCFLKNPMIFYVNMHLKFFYLAFQWSNCSCVVQPFWSSLQFDSPESQRQDKVPQLETRQVMDLLQDDPTPTGNNFICAPHMRHSKEGWELPEEDNSSPAGVDEEQASHCIE